MGFQFGWYFGNCIGILGPSRKNFRCDAAKVSCKLSMHQVEFVKLGFCCCNQEWWKLSWLVPFARYPQNMSSASQMFLGVYFSPKNAGRICGVSICLLLQIVFSGKPIISNIWCYKYFSQGVKLGFCCCDQEWWRSEVTHWGYVWIAGSFGRIGRGCCEELKILKWGWSGRMSFLWEKSGTWRWIVMNSKQSKGFFLGFTSLCLMGSWVLGEAVMSATNLSPSQLDEELRKRGREDSMVHDSISISQNSSV